MALIRCYKCGKLIDESEEFCYYCGAMIDDCDELSEIDEEKVDSDRIAKNNDASKVSKKKRINETMILSTTPSLEGYVIEKYIDVIAEDIVLKGDIFDRLSNNINDMFDSLNFSESEYSGTANMMYRAREYVREKLIYRALDLGANAIVGIDFETSISNASIAKVSMNGTAVYVRKK